jgi:hypothetical protein
MSNHFHDDSHNSKRTPLAAVTVPGFSRNIVVSAPLVVYFGNTIRNTFNS